ncbi:hypothetical protein K439DRAFT_748658 [Ramaria rubella]|nr:hypothetical protein K439DRAFT_748658 [Ramaria rubella]
MPDHVDTVTPSTGSSSQQVEQDVVKSCLEIVESRRHGDITTSEAASRFLTILPVSQERDAAFRRYVEMCAEIDREHAVAEDHAKRGEILDGSTGARGNKAPPEEIPTHLHHRVTVPQYTLPLRMRISERIQTQTGSKLQMPYIKNRGKIPISLCAPGSSVNAKEEKSTPISQRHSSFEAITSLMSKPLRKTLTVEDLAQNSLKFCGPTSSLTITSTSTGFTPVNIHSKPIIHTHKASEKLILCSMLVQGLANRTSASKHMESGLLLSPPLKQPLPTFTPTESKNCSNTDDTYIIGQFGSVALHEQWKVINLDKAIRLRVAQNNHICFNHFEQFYDLYTRHIVNTSGFFGILMLSCSRVASVCANVLRKRWIVS